MESALERTFVIFRQMTGQEEISDDLRHGTEKCIKTLFDNGETDEQRLTVGGLTYLKKASLAA